MRIVHALRVAAALAFLGAPVASALAAQCEAPAATQAKLAPIAAPGLRIGLALGSGSAHGVAHIGVIEALEGAGLEVRVVSGTSVGALIGALWASGLGAGDIERLSRASDWDEVGSFAGSWQGLMTNDRLRDQLREVFKGRAIESWPRRFGAVATNLDNGHERVLMSGDGAVAVQASSAVPVLFAPITLAGERLADGALVEPVPVAAARALGADYVIAIDVAYRPYEDSAAGMTQLGFQAMHILINSLASEQLRHADFAIRLDVHHDLMRCGREALVAAGRAAVRRAWPDLARSIAAEMRRRETP